MGSQVSHSRKWFIFMDENVKKVKEVLEAILSPQEISEVQMFLERPLLVNAIKKVLFQPILSDGTLKHGEPYNPGRNYMLQLVASQYSNQGMINNEALGQDVRAKWKATELIEVAFRELESLKKVEAKEEVKKNLAR